MTGKTLTLFGLAASIGLMLAALWVWENAAALTYTFDDAQTAAWAARSAAVGLAAAAQVLIATLVVARIYRRDRLSDFYGLSAAVVFLMSLAGAVALAIAGR